ncbi:toxin ParE1/3/4 [Parabacteroides sp. PFB2-12]|uniref:type II toxin-antitoxin system RelE/ParE family toxin n=1 Tax=unclassified Parabacteroides TaxID=2649774 RepID=UPI0024743508|nr:MULTISPECIES: type II toxin-antitoxin system RelE/ParE family toxin [unclassified Parabacteroides]MDH6341426.1 toxin ParE1/3/4 [Parabacteroides sp. PM6-13]MDH6389220.1 toxin ParE1/3/4 [Parabacteroides sp. PFB2-12]
MVARVTWTKPAVKQLREIYNYFVQVASKRTAKKIRDKIQSRTKILSNHPLAGQREELLKDMSVEFRYLVEGNYKILYWVESEIVFIASVFDSRQNPEKMKKELD